MGLRKISGCSPLFQGLRVYFSQMGKYFRERGLERGSGGA